MLMIREIIQGTDLPDTEFATDFGRNDRFRANSVKRSFNPVERQ